MERNRDDVQGELEGLMGDSAPGVPPPDPRPEPGEPTGPVEPVGPEAPEPGEPGEGDEVVVAGDAGPAPDLRLGEALDRLEERVSLLVERYGEAAREARRASERLSRLEAGGADPVELEERIRGLEAENERLSRHAEFLEERIQGLMSRVRYVMEA